MMPFTPAEELPAKEGAGMGSPTPQYERLLEQPGGIGQVLRRFQTSSSPSLEPPYAGLLAPSLALRTAAALSSPRGLSPQAISPLELRSVAALKPADSSTLWAAQADCFNEVARMRVALEEARQSEQKAIRRADIAEMLAARACHSAEEAAKVAKAAETDAMQDAAETRFHSHHRFASEEEAQLCERCDRAEEALRIQSEAIREKDAKLSAMRVTMENMEQALAESHKGSMEERDRPKDSVQEEQRSQQEARELGDINKALKRLAQVFMCLSIVLSFVIVGVSAYAWVLASETTQVDCSAECPCNVDSTYPVNRSAESLVNISAQVLNVAGSSTSATSSLSTTTVTTTGVRRCHVPHGQQYNDMDFSDCEGKGAGDICTVTCASGYTGDSKEWRCGDIEGGPESSISSEGDFYCNGLGGEIPHCISTTTTTSTTSTTTISTSTITSTSTTRSTTTITTNTSTTTSTTTFTYSNSSIYWSR